MSDIQIRCSNKKEYKQRAKAKVMTLLDNLDYEEGLSITDREELNKVINKINTALKYKKGSWNIPVYKG